MTTGRKSSTDPSSSAVDPLVHLSHTLTRHQNHLVNLYTSLGYPDPKNLASTKISDLHIGILDTIQNQAKEAEREVLELTIKSKELRDQIKSLRIRLKNHHHHIQHHFKDSSILILQDEEEMEGMDEENAEKEALFPRIERLQRIEAELLKVKADREIRIENLIKGLENYSSTLGHQFIKDKISGCGQPSLKKDLNDYFGTDLSLEFIDRLEKELEACEVELIRKNQLLEDHINEIFNLWGHLNISPTQPPDPGPVTKDFSELDNFILKHLGIRDIRVTVNGDIEPVGSCEVSKIMATDENLERLRNRRNWLDDERQRREDQIQNLYDELCILWTTLGVPEEEQEEFVESWRGLSDQSIEGYRAEVMRMTKARNEHMVLFVQKERQQIIELWDQLYVCEDDRRALEIMSSEDYSEELLKAHEQKKLELMEDLKDRKRLLAILDRYFNLLKDAHELEVAEKDPNRFAKGTRGDPGKLLREEKIRKRVSKEKPKLENDLKTLIPKWENERGKPFMINGSRFLEDLVIRLEQEAAAKSHAIAARSRSKGAPVTTSTVKRQQTGSQSCAASPVKRPRPESSVRPKKPPVSLMRGSSNPFGSATPRAPSRAGSVASSTTTTSHRIAPQATGSRMPVTRSMRSSSNLASAVPGTLKPNRTGSSISSYNPITPTPLCKASGQARLMKENRKPPSDLIEEDGDEDHNGQGAGEELIQACGTSRSVSAQSSCPGIPPGWPSNQINLHNSESSSKHPTIATAVTTTTGAVQAKKVYSRFDCNSLNGLGNGRPAPPLQKGTFRPRPSVMNSQPPPPSSLQLKQPSSPSSAMTKAEADRAKLPLSDIKDKNSKDGSDVFTAKSGEAEEDGQGFEKMRNFSSNTVHTSNSESIRSFIIKSDISRLNSFGSNEALQ
ncbi:microtubule associated protein-domain-containing protein [Phakopsora pachyrhizi]|nr:microtubule associated protein-domain-containing protein [Phakopsora pachyrhizi]